MSFAKSLDHTATVFRLTEGLDEYRSATNTYTAQSAAIKIALGPASEGRADQGPGETPIGRRAAFALARADVKETDVLGITAGPEAPRRYRVVSHTKAPRNHHTVLVLDPFNGKMPGDD